MRQMSTSTFYHRLKVPDKKSMQLHQEHTVVVSELHQNMGGGRRYNRHHNWDCVFPLVFFILTSFWFWFL